MRHIPHDVETPYEVFPEMRGLKGVLGSRNGNDIDAFPHQHQHPRLQSPRSHPEGEETVMPAPEATHNMLDSCGEPEISGVRQDDEDGWVSDRSWSEDARRQTAKHHHCRLSKRRHTDRHHSSIHVYHHSRLPLHHHPRLPLHHHSHVPMGISTSSTPAAGSPKLALDTSNSEAEPSSMTVDEETRGRRLPSSTPSTPERLPRHMRIMSLRGSAASSREVSPVRSIRWADEGTGASPATARWPQSPCASPLSSRAPSRAPSPGPSTPGESIEPDLG